MATYIEYELEEGITILIEGPDEGKGGTTKASRGDDTYVEKAKKKFSEALSDVKVHARTLIQEIEELHVDEAEVKFGLSTVGELGNLAIGKVGLGVNYEVTLKWKKPEQRRSDSREN